MVSAIVRTMVKTIMKTMVLEGVGNATYPSYLGRLGVGRHL